MITKDFICLGFAFLISFVLSLATTPLAKRVAYLIGAVDIPRDNRRMHTRPIPRCGGLAIIFGFMVAVLCFGPPTRGLSATMIGAGIIAVMGIVDDCKTLDAKLKFAIQIIAALILVYGGDFKIDAMTNPNVFSNNPYIVFPWWLSGIITVVWVVFITNADNFIDGLDGLAAGVSAIMSVSLVFIAIRTGEYSVAVLGTALLGSCLGFLPFNFNPARIFMGDTGSTFLGFILASLSIQGVFKSYAVISFAVPLLILGLPLFDAMFAMLRRILKGQNPMTADRGHLHHRLIDIGFSTKRSVFILYAISGVLGLTAVMLAEWGAFVALGILLVVLIAILMQTTLFARHKKKQNDTDNEGEKSTENN